MSSYVRPAALTDALSTLAEGGWRVAAGCTDLFPATEAHCLPGPVLDITSIAALNGIAHGPGGVRIGANATWTDIIRAKLPPSFDMLKQAARDVGSVQIQNAGTLAGNLCNASPAADGVPCLLALDADVELTSLRGVRLLPLSAFLTGPRQTALMPDELLTAVVIPDHAVTGISRFLKLGARRYLVISIAMVAARLHVEDDVICQAALSVGACSAVAKRLPLAEAALVGMRIQPGVERALKTEMLAGLAPIDDVRADAGYRETAALELLRRAVADLAASQARVAA